MSAFEIDLAYVEFQSKKESLLAACTDGNEAATRLKIIDELLLRVLDWTLPDIDVEKYCREAGYADYVLYSNDRPCLTLEAKRDGVAFLIDNCTFENRPYAFAFLAKECKSAAKALQQAIGYAATVGSRYVAITNGHQWVLTLTFVQDQSLDDRLVFVFESLDAIDNRFRRFVECFSKEQLSLNTPLASLVESLQKSPPPKLAASIPGYPQAATRNVFRNELAFILDYVWRLMSEDEGTEDFVKHCYVNPSSHTEVVALVRELMSRRITEDEQLSHYSIDGVESLPVQMSHLPSQKPFVVLGEIGRGKTSFLKYLRYVAASDLFEKYIQIDINFLDRPDVARDVHQYIYAEIERQLLESYGIDVNDDSFVRGVLHVDIGRLRNTPEGRLLLDTPVDYAKYEIREIKNLIADRHSYLTKAFLHLKRGRNHSVAIFFDNLDRRSQEIQEEAFLKSSAIARDWACLVFVCLRPDTFHKSQESGVLDTIAPQTFTVSHPDLSVVLKRRFAYAKAIAEGTRLPHNISAGGLNRNIAFELPQVASILGSCEFSAWKKRGIVPLLEAVSNGNIRRMLTYAKAILCSGHLDTKKICKQIEESGSYTIPDFEGIKALLFGEYMQYDPTSSPFVNLFDVIHANSLEHFVRLAILRFLAGVQSDGVDAGFLQRAHLGAYLSGCGFSMDAIESGIDHLIRKELLRVRVGETGSSAQSQRVRITASGRFHLQNLPPIFQYLDAMVVDTPIMDAKVRSGFADVSTINERIARTRLFLSYLDNASNALKDLHLKEVWNEISLIAWQGIEDIIARIANK